MKPIKYRGYLITESSGGGKAGKGKNRTATIRVSRPAPMGHEVIKEIRFEVGNRESAGLAIIKAHQYISTLPEILPLV
jgi:hypothetical protein